MQQELIEQVITRLKAGDKIRLVNQDVSLLIKMNREPWRKKPIIVHAKGIEAGNVLILAFTAFNKLFSFTDDIEQHNNQEFDHIEDSTEEQWRGATQTLLHEEA